MKKHLLLIASLFIFVGLVLPSPSRAQGMMGGTNAISLESDGHTAREEAEGKEVWEKLQAKEISCDDISDDDFGAVGEYFMGQMMGDSHEAMNSRLIQILGEEGEEEMHVAMGKRMSGCDSDAPLPQNMMGGGMMSMMMNMMMGGGVNPMMGSFGPSPMGLSGWGFGWVFMLLFWGLVILGIVALIKWLANQGKGQTQDKSALDILKQRYAKGEVDKKEFEEKKKDLS